MKAVHILSVALPILFPSFALGKQERMFNPWTSAKLCEMQKRLLATDWHSSCHCSHVGSKVTDGRSLSHCPTFSLQLFISNKNQRECNRGQPCALANKDTAIAYGHWFIACMLHFRSNSLKTGLERKWKMAQALGCLSLSWRLGQDTWIMTSDFLTSGHSDYLRSGPEDGRCLSISLFLSSCAFQTNKFYEKQRKKERKNCNRKWHCG